MKIKKYKYICGDFHYYYINDKTDDWIYHGLFNFCNDIYYKRIGYKYKNNRKGFTLTEIKF